ncbi:hypothetical protein O6H91_10G059400 [Diphasiastrum complanatum]|uniref:Uncharacterized protein n=1 Tax=Diphasiastrum complanatum TaxID=34168 RepID=A0ACC2CH98_DIPCM|nr:hypothetical protein O6H91_10G059400 [Diphasiastrum complanatum]
MSVISVTTLDSFIEPSDQNSRQSPGTRKDDINEKRPVYTYHVYTPAPVNRYQPRSPSPSSFSLSPFIVNYKGRPPGRWEIPSAYSENGINTRTAASDQVVITRTEPSCNGDEVSQGLYCDRETSNDESSQAFDEFFDAPEAPLYENAGHLAEWKCSSDSRITANSFEGLHTDAKRRGRAEKTSVLFQGQQEESDKRAFTVEHHIQSSLVQKLDQVQGWNVVEQMEQKLEVAKLVASAIAKGVTKAEMQEDIEITVTTKNREISRLRDKLQYYEIVKHEMSQRNQEATEHARRQRRRHQKMLNWTLGCLAAGLCFGASVAVVYKYFSFENSTASQLQSAVHLDENQMSNQASDL